MSYICPECKEPMLADCACPLKQLEAKNRELEATLAAWRNALLEIRRQAWAAQLGNPVDLNRIAIAADVVLSSTTAGADLLKRIEGLEAAGESYRQSIVGAASEVRACNRAIADLESQIAVLEFQLQQAEME